MNVDEKGATGDDVVLPLAPAREAPWGPLAAGHGAHSPHGSHRRRSRQNPPGGGDRRGLRLAAHGQRGGALMGEDADSNRL